MNHRICTDSFRDSKLARQPVAFRSSAPTLLLVAGHSGAGKSTFMRMLQSGRLGSQVDIQLPEGASLWPQFGHRRRHVPSTQDPCVLHYTTNYPHLIGSSFEADPMLEPLRRAQSAVVVTLRANADTLISQRQRRMLQRLRAQTLLRRLSHQIRYCLLDALRLATEDEKSDVLALYRRPGWVQACYDEWDAYIRKESTLRQLRVIDVVRAQDGSFRAERRHTGLTLMRRGWL